MSDAAGTYTPGSYCSYRQIASLTVPAILLNAAAPATTTVQTVLLGHLDSDVKEQVAAFAAVSVVSNFVTFLLNFLVRLSWLAVASPHGCFHDCFSWTLDFVPLRHTSWHTDQKQASNT